MRKVKARVPNRSLLQSSLVNGSLRIKAEGSGEGELNGKHSYWMADPGNLKARWKRMSSLDARRLGKG